MEHESKSIEIIREMRSVIAEAEAIGPWIDGHLLKNKRTKYVKKDGSVSYYPTLPILQYRVGPGKRRSKRIPLERVAEIEQLIRDGARFKALMARYTELAARLSLDVKKKKEPDSGVSCPADGPRAGGAGRAVGGGRGGRPGRPSRGGRHA
jgi:hypothetical protein